MTHEGRDVKVPDANGRNWIQRRFADLMQFVDCHPRAGWMWFALMIINTILNLLDVFH